TGAPAAQTPSGCPLRSSPPRFTFTRLRGGSALWVAQGACRCMPAIPRPHAGRADQSQACLLTAPQPRVAPTRHTPEANARLLGAPDASGAHDDVVKIAFLGRGRSVVPVVLEEHRLDTVIAEGAEEIACRFPRFQVAVHPELEYAVGNTRVVERRVRLDAVPPADVAHVEQRRDPDFPAQPCEMAEVVVPRGAQRPGTVRAAYRVELQMVRVAVVATPDVRDHRLRPFR